METRGDHRNKKLLMNKSVKTLITLKGGHQGLLKLHVLHMERVFQCMGKMGLLKENFCLKRKNNIRCALGINIPSKIPPSSSASPPLNLQTFQVSLFRQSPPIY